MLAMSTLLNINGDGKGGSILAMGHVAPAMVTVAGGATLAMGASSDVYGVGEGSRWLWACVATSTFLSR
jgi:hypothetical protein